jgi:hypothetical protein
MLTWTKLVRTTKACLRVEVEERAGFGASVESGSKIVSTETFSTVLLELALLR